MSVQHIPQQEEASFFHAPRNKQHYNTHQSSKIGIQKPTSQPPLIVQGDIRTDRRENTARRMKVQKKYCPQKSMQCCGSAAGNVQISVGTKHKRAFRTGINTCKSPSCPYCATRMSRKRFEIMSTAVQGNAGTDNASMFGTFTIPNTSKFIDAKGITKVWSRWWARTKNKYRRSHPDMELGYFRSIETTFQVERRNKYHTHLHFILGIKNSDGLACLKTFGDELVSFWKDAVEKEIGKVAARSAQRIDILDGGQGAAVRYMANPMKVLFELDGTTKTRKNVGGGISLWALLDDIYLAEQTGDSQRLVRIYREFMEGMRGVRVLTSGGMWLNSKKAIEEECFEEEEQEPEDTEILHYDRHIHNSIRSWNDTYAVKLVEDFVFRNMRREEFKEFTELIIALYGKGDFYPSVVREYIHDHLKKYRIVRI